MEAQVTLEGRPFSYHWKPSARRRSLAISIHPEQGLVVYSPGRTPRTRVEQFLRSKARWIVRHLARMEQERASRPAIRWGQGAWLPYRGGQILLQMVLDGGTEQVRLESDLLLVGLPLDAAGDEPDRRLKERVEAWYRDQAGTLIAERVEHFKQRLEVEPARVRIKRQKQRWGSCSARGSLNFNWLLLLAPPPILDYVVVHELCHLTVPNHSPRFWALVAGILPDFRERRTWLRKHGYLLTLV